MGRKRKIGYEGAGGGGGGKEIDIKGRAYRGGEETCTPLMR